MQAVSDQTVSSIHDRTTRDRGGGGMLMTRGRTVLCSGAVPSLTADVASLMQMNVSRARPAHD